MRAVFVSGRESVGTVAVVMRALAVHANTGARHGDGHHGVDGERMRVGDWRGAEWCGAGSTEACNRTSMRFVEY